MRISELVKTLQEAQWLYGDHPVSTFAGTVKHIKITPAKDGICHPLKLRDMNEISLEILT